MLKLTVRRFIGAALMTIGAVLVTTQGGASAKAAVRADQCANRTTTCDTAHPARWISGAINESKADYSEGDSLPYRAVFSDLTVDASYSLQIAYDTTKGGKHAIDYLTTYDRTEATADPCAGYTCSTPTSTLAIPPDSNIPAGIQLAGQVLTAFGATFVAPLTDIPNTGDLCGSATCSIPANPVAYDLENDYTGDSTTRLRVYFTAKADTVVLAWGGHIAARFDWGIGSSAATINGSPYHTHMDDFDCSDAVNCNVGEEDLALASTAVVLPASITIVKNVEGTSGTSFPFTAAPSPLSNFSLVDDGTVANTHVFSGIIDFATYVITEGSVDNWTLDGAGCSVRDPNGGSQSVDGAAVTIDLREGEQVICTFTNERIPVPDLDIDKSAEPDSYSAAGDVITYTYVLTNVGETVLGPTQFTVDDDHVNSGAPFNCGPANTTLALGGTVTCTATYTVTLDDIEGGSVLNTAFGAGAGLTTGSAQATVVYAAVSTTEGGSTTSTSDGNVTTSTGNGVTTSSIATTTTIADEFFIIYPDEFPNSGANDGIYVGLGVVAMLAGLVMLVATFDPDRRRHLHLVRGDDDVS